MSVTHTPQPTSLSGLDPHKALTQYVQDVWHTRDGLPQSYVTTIAQSQDGYLWVGTQEGLARFDGVRFTVFDTRNTPELPHNHVQTLCASRDGSLWIGTFGGGLACLRDGAWTTYAPGDGLPNSIIWALCEDETGALWIGSTTGLLRFDEGTFTMFTDTDGFPLADVSALCSGPDGGLWIGTYASGVARYRDGTFTTFTTADGLVNNGVRSLYVDAQGTVWFGTHAGMSSLKDGHWTTYTTHNGLPNNIVSALHRDRMGSLWVGTNGGLARLYDDQFSVYTTTHGLANDIVECFHEDQEGNLWFGTLGGGLTRLHDGVFTTYTRHEGLAHDSVMPVCEARDGTLWVGTNNGLSCYQHGQWRTFTIEDGLADNAVRSLCEDHNGNVWIGTFNGLSRLHDGSFTTFTTADGLPHASIRAIYELHDGTLLLSTSGGLARFVDPTFIVEPIPGGSVTTGVFAMLQDRTGALWLGTEGSGLVRIRGDEVTYYTVKTGLAHDLVMSLHEDSAGDLWVGTYGGGLTRVRNGVLHSFTVHDGLFDNVIYQILEDDRAHLWLTCNKGIFRVSKDELEQRATGLIDAVGCTVYTTSDGLKSIDCHGGSHPAGCRSSDDRLWFPTASGIAVVDPQRLSINDRPPPVLIEHVVIDKQVYQPNDTPHVGPSTKNFEFHYTGLSFVAPDRVCFRYKLEGFDREWIDAGTRRVAYYTNIPPGHYRFRVVASNNSDVWNLEGASFSFDLEPHFYQTAAFYTLCSVGLMLAGVAGYRLRTEQLKCRARQLVALVAERTAQLAEANRKLEAQARQLAEANHLLQHLSYVDALTGIANRRQFEDGLRQEWRRAARNRQSIGLILLDIDYFKAYNDLYGHQRGDTTLKQVARVLQQSIQRTGDLVARYGGEEFVVVLPLNDIPSTVAVANKLRLNIKRLAIPHAGSPTGHITASLGVVSLVPVPDAAPTTLVSLADTALYCAKRLGRDRIELADAC